MNYETLRGMADSWGLVFLTCVFIFVVLFSFRRGTKKKYQDAANIPLRDADQNREVSRDQS